MGVNRRIGAKRREDEQLPRSVRDVIGATDDVRDPHVAIVDCDGEVVEGAAVGAGDHEVVNGCMLEDDLSANDILHGCRPGVWHTQPYGTLVSIGVPVVDESRDLLAMPVRPLGLREGPLVPVQLKPVERVVDLLDVLAARPLAVGVLDSQREAATGPARQEPVVQCRPRATDVKGACRRRSEPDPHLVLHTSMLIGGHVSTAGGLAKAHARGVALGADAIQIFNQSPRMWRPTNYKQADIEGFQALMNDGPLRSVVIHAVYLINAASKVPEIRQKSLASLTHALRVGDAIGADGVVFHPGSTVGEPLGESLERVGEAIRRVLEDSEECALLLEDTAGAGGTIGRSFEELALLLELADGDPRVGICLDCCHLLASGYDIRTAEGLGAAIDDFDGAIGLERLRCLHVNDSQASLGTNRDRHANLPDGELGRIGLGAFLSEPRFEDLAAFLEVPGTDGKGPDAEQIAIARELRAEGLRSRAGQRPVC